MDTNETTDKLIEKYAKNEITEEEKDMLRKLAENNPELLQEIEARVDIARSVKYLGNEQLKSRVQNIINEKPFTGSSRNKGSKTIISLKLLSILSLVAIALIGYSKCFHKINSKSNEALYASHYQAYEASFHTRSKAEVNMQEYKEAYTAKNYTKALGIISEIETIEDNEVLLTAGISALEVGDTKLCRSYLTKLMERDDYFFGDYALWYSALSYLKDNNYEAARPLINELASNPEAGHYQDAKIIEKQINPR